jgi:hypothetical protein
MRPLFTRLLRGAVLGMMLLLSAMASMVCFSYDADGDESTPPVTVEFSGIPSKKAVQISAPQSIAGTHFVRDVQSASPDTQVAALVFPSVQTTESTLPQFGLPLRR